MAFFYGGQSFNMILCAITTYYLPQPIGDNLRPIYYNNEPRGVAP